MMHYNYFQFAPELSSTGLQKKEDEKVSALVTKTEFKPKALKQALSAGLLTQSEDIEARLKEGIAEGFEAAHKKEEFTVKIASKESEVIGYQPHPEEVAKSGEGLQFASATQGSEPKTLNHAKNLAFTEGVGDIDYSRNEW